MAHTKLVGVSRTGEELTDLAGSTPQNLQWLVHLDPVQYKDVAYSFFFFYRYFLDAFCNSSVLYNIN